MTGPEEAAPTVGAAPPSVLPPAATPEPQPNGAEAAQVERKGEIEVPFRSLTLKVEPPKGDFTFELRDIQHREPDQMSVGLAILELLVGPEQYNAIRDAVRDIPPLQSSEEIGELSERLLKDLGFGPGESKASPDS